MARPARREWRRVGTWFPGAGAPLPGRDRGPGNWKRRAGRRSNENETPGVHWGAYSSESACSASSRLPPRKRTVGTRRTTPVLGTMMARISESGIHRTVSDLQNTPHPGLPVFREPEICDTCTAGSRASLDCRVLLPGGELSKRHRDTAGRRVSAVRRNYRRRITTTPTSSGFPVITLRRHGQRRGSGCHRARSPVVMSGQCSSTVQVRFAFWNAEEQGMLGSAAYVADVSADGAAMPALPELRQLPRTTRTAETSSTSCTTPGPGRSREQMTRLDCLYGTGINLTQNVFDCG